LVSNTPQSALSRIDKGVIGDSVGAILHDNSSSGLPNWLAEFEAFEPHHILLKRKWLFAFLKHLRLRDLYREHVLANARQTLLDCVVERFNMVA
jgi:hypothetical protein